VQSPDGRRERLALHEIAFLSGLVEQPCFKAASCDRTRDVGTTSATENDLLEKASLLQKAIVSTRGR